MSAPRGTIGLLIAGLMAIGSCGGDSDPATSGSSTTPTGSAPTTTAAATPTTPTTVLPATTVTLTAPATLAPVSGDPLLPETWIGHDFRESMSGSPFATVTLDGEQMGFISASDGCGMMDAPSLPPACIAFVRPDPGPSAGFADPGPWLVLSWQVSDPTNYTLGGPVFDAVAVTFTEPYTLPEGQCRAVDGTPGVYSGFVLYDPDYRPAPDATGLSQADIDAHPVQRAWTVDSADQLVELDASLVECVLYSFGD